MKSLTRNSISGMGAILFFLLFVNILPAPGQSQAGYKIESPSPNNDGVLSILVYYDMEGLSGQSDWKSILFHYTKHYRQGQELLAADVNAVIDGLFAPMRCTSSISTRAVIRSRTCAPTSLIFAPGRCCGKNPLK